MCDVETDLSKRCLTCVHSSGFESPSAAVVASVAAVLGENPIELDPLYDRVDPDSLDTAVATMRPDARIEFAYHHCNVAVDGGGYVYVADCELFE